MDNIQKLYEKLWKSLIRPQRFPYSEIDLGGEEIEFTNYNAIRMDFRLSNAIKETFNLSLYLPCDEKYNLKFHGEYIVYCHTHSGSRTEGLHLVEESIERGIGIVLFDFRANGYSSGKYVTLGWFEALDVNQVVNFLKSEAKAKSICLWGRSMGGAAIVFFMSAKYRNTIDRIFAKRSLQKVNWAPQKIIDCVVLDSQFNYLNQSIHNMVSSKTNKIPAWIISIVISMLEAEISKRTLIKLSLMNPTDFFKGFKTPVFSILGNTDEMVRQKEFCENFKKIESKIKKFQIFVGNHTEDRPQHIIDQVYGYIQHVFSMKKIYLKNLKSQPKKTRQSYSIFEPAPQISYLDYTMAQIQINKNTEKAFQPKSLVQNQNVVKSNYDQRFLSPIKEDFDENFSDLKNSLKKSIKFNPQDPNLQLYENDFNVQTEEDQRRQRETAEQIQFDKDLAENIIIEQKIPKASINMLRNEKYTDKSYLRGLSFQVKKSTLRGKFRTKNNLVQKKIQPQILFPQKQNLEQLQPLQQISQQQKQHQLSSQKNVFVPEYNQVSQHKTSQRIIYTQNHLQQQPQRLQTIQSNRNTVDSSQRFIQNSFVPQNLQQMKNPGRQTVPVQFVDYSKPQQQLFPSQLKPQQNAQKIFPQISQYESQFQKPQQIQPEFFQRTQNMHQIGQAKIKETETVFLNFNKQSNKFN